MTLTSFHLMKELVCAVLRTRDMEGYEEDQMLEIFSRFGSIVEEDNDKPSFDIYYGGKRYTVSVKESEKQDVSIPG